MVEVLAYHVADVSFRLPCHLLRVRDEGEDHTQNRGAVMVFALDESTSAVMGDSQSPYGTISLVTIVGVFGAVSVFVDILFPEGLQ